MALDAYRNHIGLKICTLHPRVGFVIQHCDFDD